jgi:hypothetical protein
VESHYRLEAGGRLVAGEVRALLPDGTAGAASDWFELSGDSARWTRGSTSGGARIDASAFYRPDSNTPFDFAMLARFALSRPDQTARLLPVGSARVEVAADTMVATTAGARRVRFVEITTPPSGTVVGVWLDEDDELFASGIGWFITVRPDARGALPTLRAIELARTEARAAAIARSLAASAPDVTVIHAGDVFDSERGVILPRHSVLIHGDRIIAVAPADSVAVPPGAHVIDAAGRTVLPGMWDMHTHFQHYSQTGASLIQLAAGITTVRDLAADIDVATSHRDRANALEIVAPRVVLGGFIEGPGAWAGPSEALARTEDEARAWIARYDSLGYRQVKLYNLVHPDLVPAIADEARRRGMRLSGHIPRGMSVESAIRLGFDEINHAAFFFSTFFPDSLFTPSMRAYSAVASAVASGFDVDGEAMSRIIDVLREHGTVVDGTFNIWMGGRAPLNGRMDPAAASYGRLLKRLYDAGVTLVPGTDNLASATFVTELELYQLVGIPAPEVLRMATIVAARVMNEDADYGSITPGKIADIIVVNGQPAEQVADLSRIELVLRAGRAFAPDDLRAASRTRQ